MKIIEIIKECRARDARLWSPVAGYKNDLNQGLGIAYGDCSDMLEETVRGIQKKLSKVKADAKNGELSGPIRADAEAMAVILEWMLGEDQL